MKKFVFLLVLINCFSCKKTQKQTNTTTQVVTHYGVRISDYGALNTKDAATVYERLQIGDTTTIKIAAPISGVCANKGCWLQLELEKEKSVFVKFKDYDFFVPTDAQGDAVVSGKAFIEEVSVLEQQYLAIDEGQSADYIAAITEPKRQLQFLADGVLIKK